MELWKVHKFCGTASLRELLDREQRLTALINQGQLQGTNAATALRILREYIDLKKLFGDD